MDRLRRMYKIALIAFLAAAFVTIEIFTDGFLPWFLWMMVLCIITFTGTRFLIVFFGRKMTDALFTEVGYFTGFITEADHIAAKKNGIKPVGPLAKWVLRDWIAEEKAWRSGRGNDPATG